MGVVETPRDLDGHVEHVVESAQLPGPDTVVHAAAVHELREHHGDALQAADVEAGHGVGMQTQVHPGLGFALEEVGPALQVQHGQPRHLGREVHVPAAVADPVHPAHPSFPEQAQHLVEVEQDVAHLPLR